MIMAQCLFARLHELGHQIDVFAPEWTGALIECMPECDKLLASPFDHGQLQMRKRYAWAKSLRGQYDSAYILPNSFKSALIPFWAKIPQRIAWRGEWRDLLLTQVCKAPLKQYPLMVQRYMALVNEQSYQLPASAFTPQLQVPIHIQEQVLHKYPFINEPFLAMCPGAAFGPSKQWIASRFKEVCTHFANKMSIVFLGSPKDTLITNQISPGLNNIYDLAGKTNLLEAIAVMSRSQTVLTHDSGLMHVAAALNRPLVALYGSSSPTFTPPLHEKAKIIQHDVGCNPCFKRQCVKPQHDCMLAIRSNEVIEILESIV